MPKFKFILIIAFSFIVALSCKKKESKTNEAENTQVTKVSNDTLQGKVYFTRDSSAVPNATVSIVGTTFQTISDQTGFYRFTNVGAGTYDIDVLTPKNRRNQVQQVSHAAGSTTTIYLKTIDDDFSDPNNTLSVTVVTTTNGTRYLAINFDYEYDGGSPYVMVVLSDSTGADPAQANTFDYSLNNYLGPYRTLLFEINPKNYYLTGTKVYVDVYLHYSKKSLYTDVHTNRLVYIGGGESRTPNAFVNWP